MVWSPSRTSVIGAFSTVQRFEPRGAIRFTIKLRSGSRLTILARCPDRDWRQRGTGRANATSEASPHERRAVLREVDNAIERNTCADKIVAGLRVVRRTAPSAFQFQY